MNEWMNEWTNEWMQEGRKEGMNEWMNESMNEWMNECMNDWMTMNGRMNEWMHEWMKEWMNECMNEWMHEWMHEPKVIRAPRFFYERLFKPEFTHSRPVALATTWWWVRMMMWLASWWHYDDVVDIWNRALATVLCTFCRPHLPKVLQTRKFFNILRLFPTSSSKNAPNPTVFACSSSGNWALDTVSWHVVHRPKVLQARQFFYASYVSEIELSLFLCAFCRPHRTREIELSLQSCANSAGHFPQSSRKTPETETLLRRPAATLPEIIEGFAPENVFKIFQAWIHAFPISHASQLLLTWWCGCHDDCGDDVVAITVRKLAMTIVRNSEVS